MPECQSPLEYLITSSRSSLEGFELARLNRAANLKKELRQILEEWVQTEADARLARWVLECRRNGDRSDAPTADIQTIQDLPLRELEVSFWGEPSDKRPADGFETHQTECCPNLVPEKSRSPVHTQISPHGVPPQESALPNPRNAAATLRVLQRFGSTSDARTTHDLPLSKRESSFSGELLERAARAEGAPQPDVLLEDPNADESQAAASCFPPQKFGPPNPKNPPVALQLSQRSALTASRSSGMTMKETHGDTRDSTARIAHLRRHAFFPNPVYPAASRETRARASAGYRGNVCPSARNGSWSQPVATRSR